MTYYQHLLQATEKECNALLATPVITDSMQGVITMETYQAFLSKAYHHARYTVPLLMACETAKTISNVRDLPRSVVQQQVA